MSVQSLILLNVQIHVIVHWFLENVANSKDWVRFWSVLASLNLFL
jgi:hypothetical protein